MKLANPIPHPIRPRLLGALALTACGSVAAAQIQEAWVATLPFANSFQRYAFDASGRTAVASLEAGDRLVVELYDTDGNRLWTRAWAGATNAPGGIAFGPSTEVVVSASIAGTPFGSDIVTTAYDVAGTVLWSRTWNGPGVNSFDGAGDVEIAPNGDVYVAGVGKSATNSADALLLRYDALGNLQWSAFANGSAQRSDYAAALALDANGGAVVVGGANQAQTGSDAFVARFDGGGNIAWTREFSNGVTGFERALSVAIDAVGDAYVSSLLQTNGASRASLAKLDATGNVVWRIDDTVDTGTGIQVALDVRGDVFHVATSALGIGVPAFALRKYAPNGALMWERTHVHSPYGIALDAAGEVLVYGSDPTSAAIRAFATLFDRDGTERWSVVRSHPVGSILFYDAAFDAAGALHFGGYPTDRMLAARWDPNVRSICAGDGSASACPCANASAIGDREGCLNSLGLGARLDHAGLSSLSNDTLELRVTRVPNAPATFFQGSTAIGGGQGVAFGDGLRCAGGSLIRLATHVAASQATSYPKGAEAPVSIRGAVASPGMRAYQMLYRNSASFCTSDTFNLTNALLVTWVP